jgi:hypothetical protein
MRKCGIKGQCSTCIFVCCINDLDILSCHIGNAYLNAPCQEKIWFEAGKECVGCRQSSDLNTSSVWVKVCRCFMEGNFSNSIFELGIKIQWLILMFLFSVTSDKMVMLTMNCY